MCILTVTSRASDFRAEVLIDIAGPQFSPNVRIDSTGLKDKEQLDSVLACDSPFDVDDDASDDSKTIIFAEDEGSVIQSSSLIWGTSVALLVIGIYLFIVQRQDSGRIRSMNQERNNKPSKNNKPMEDATVETEPEDINSEEDDISTIIESEDDAPPLTLIEEIPDQDDLTPSGRLDSLRKEMNPEEEDEEKSSIEERMSKFFK